MKLFKTITLSSILVMTLVGCDNKPDINIVPTDEGNRFNGIDADTINIITDSKTGCKYIYVEDGQGNYRTTAMSPLYKTDGTVECDKNY
jgi:uncharacterized lipoprotein NlpE involved in copper resistance